ncbi:MAG TPA: prepilin-type N-terminal cleavage/methylation domain-containing protein [Bacillota bacterium]|nr:prepilin-type N-terminal cleavage/methylation domain-containing protein [Bacillota bacterium]
MKNEKGMTLVEVLATLVIVSIVIIFLVGIQVVVQKQFKSQTTSTEQLTDITIAMKSITKELRLAEEVSANESELLIQLAPDEQVSYVLQEDTLQRNDSDYIHEIKNFFVEKRDNNKVYISIESETGKQLETEIVGRGE